MVSRFWVLLGLFAAAKAQAADLGPKRFFALADSNRLTLAIGKWEPSKGWKPSTAFYEPPAPGDPFTIYGIEGAAGEVQVTEARAPNPGGTFSGWNAAISRWNSAVQPFGLAVKGPPLATETPVRSVPLDDPNARGIASRYLLSKGLHVEKPLLTQAFSLSLGASLGDALVICAHSDESALRDKEEANIYAVCLVNRGADGEKIIPLTSQTAFKPADRTLDRQKVLYGTREFDRLITAADLNGEGQVELVIYRAQPDSTTVDVYGWKNLQSVKVLSAYQSLIYQ